MQSTFLASRVRIEEGRGPWRTQDFTEQAEKEDPTHEGRGREGKKREERAWREGGTETKEREDVADSIMLHGGPIQGTRNVTMGGHRLP